MGRCQLHNFLAAATGSATSSSPVSATAPCSSPAPTSSAPRRTETARVAVLRAAVELGIRHIDTADYYGPHVTNELIREALAPYPDDLHLVTKVGARRDEQGGWPQARTPAELRLPGPRQPGPPRARGARRRQSADGRHRGAPSRARSSPQFETLAQLRQEGLIRHLGLSTVTAEQLAEAQSIAPVACVQNLYNLARRGDDALVDLTARQGIAYVPYFPLGGFTPLQSEALEAVAARLGVTPMAVALAWLLQRSPNILLIPGTSSVAHLRENVAGAALELSPEEVAELDAIGR